jgi:CheY-like chemotaxis protein
MVVDDDLPILEMMDLLLRRIDYEPVLVSNVHAALDIVKSDPPSLILLDVMMTPVTGWQFLEKVRGECQKKELPVLLFTASPSAEEITIRMHDPYLGMLQKPVSMNQLKTEIDKFIDPKHRTL